MVVSNSSDAVPEPPERKMEFARSALASTDELAEQAIASNPDRTTEDVLRMCEVIQDPLISSPKSHSAVVGNGEAKRAGLPVRELKLGDSWWQEIWQLWAKYYTLGPVHLLSAYGGGESLAASHPSAIFG